MIIKVAAVAARAAAASGVDQRKRSRSLRHRRVKRTSIVQMISFFGRSSFDVVAIFSLSLPQLRRRSAPRPVCLFARLHVSDLSSK